MDGAVKGEQTIDYTEQFGGATGEFGILTTLGRFQVADLFENVIPVTEGSVVSVEERIELQFLIDDEIRIDLDKRWFGGRPYLGTYRLQDERDLRGAFFNPAREGFLSYVNVSLEAQSEYLVVTRKERSRAAGGSVVLDPCNDEMAPRRNSLGFLPLVGSAESLVNVGSFQSHKGYYSMDTFPLGVGLIRERIAAVNLYLNKGVSLASAVKRIRIQGLVESSRPSAPTSVACEGLSGQCADLTAAFLAANPRFFISPAEIDPGLFAENYIVSTGQVELGAGCVVRYYVIDDVLLG